jgi:hypothetical protein
MREAADLPDMKDDQTIPAAPLARVDRATGEEPPRTRWVRPDGRSLLR